jgi:hypothetical protein
VTKPSSGDGWGINLIWQVTEGKYENRYVWQWLTIQHSSEQATRIGRRQFKDLCVACNLSEQVKDVAPFMYIPCQIRVTTKPDQNGDDRNNVSRIFHIDAQVPQPRRSSKLAQSVKPSAPAAPAPVTTAAQSTATAAPAAKPASNATSGSNGNVPPWRQAKPSPSEDLDDKVPY